METRKFFLFFVALLSSCHSVFALTIINQTNSIKMIELDEAYWPESDHQRNLAAPLSLGYGSQKIIVQAHSIERISLRAPCKILILGIIAESKKGKKAVTSMMQTYYEPYTYQNQQEEHFSDNWGFVIHKPIEEKLGSIFQRDYWLKKNILEKNKTQGFGIKCLHPLLVDKVTSLEELPEILNGFFLGETLFGSAFKPY